MSEKKLPQQPAQLEIERKFMVSALPPLSNVEHAYLKQGYISTDPTIRLRSEDDSRFFLTVKGRGNIIREEYEREITRGQFESLWLKVEGFAIEKIRFKIPLGESGLTAELDEYLGRLKGLYTVEVEFDSPEAAASFAPPDWFGLDITDDHRYRNGRLSKELPPGL